MPVEQVALAPDWTAGIEYNRSLGITPAQSLNTDSYQVMETPLNLTAQAQDRLIPVEFLVSLIHKSGMFREMTEASRPNKTPEHGIISPEGGWILRS